MTHDQDKTLREQLVIAMRGDQAHLDFEAAIQDFPLASAGVKWEGAPHTAWQLLEHMRIALHDILEFSRNPRHQSPPWPEGYWPQYDAPQDAKAWDACIAAFREHSKAMEDLISDPNQDLFKPIEGGTGQTLLREALLVAAHNSYHLGQLVFLKKAILES
jgi:hypothetical protein